MNRLPITPNSKITSMLRRLFLWSREHQAVLKRDKYTCQKCGVKKSTKNKLKLNVHHILGHINWELIIKIIREELLVDPDLMLLVCSECHKKIHLTQEHKTCKTVGNQERESHDISS